MNINNRIVANLRNQLHEAQRDMRAYRNLYRNERTDRRQQQRHCNELEQTLGNFFDENEALKNEIDFLRRHVSLFEVPKPKKKWHQLRSGNSIGKRKSEYRQCLNQSMIHLHEVKRARVQLRIGKKEIVFIWCQNELKEMRNNLKNNIKSNERKNNDYDDTITDTDDICEDHDAFLPDGNWNEAHLRKIIHVMDVFRISFQAYHELWMTSNSILPPLS